MENPKVSPTFLLLFLALGAFLTMLSVLMLGPLLVELADEFHTSVAVAGRMAEDTSIAAVADIFPPEGRGKAIC